MMNSQPHPDLSAYLHGRLSLAQMEVIERHVEQCPACLARLEALTPEAPLGLTGDDPIPELAPQASHKLRGRTFRQLRRSHLSGQALRLGTQGFLDVVWAIMRPLLSFTNTEGNAKTQRARR